MKALHFLPAIVFFILATILLCLPGSSLPHNRFFASIPQFDKLVHIFLFATLGICFGYPVIKSRLDKAKRLKWIILISLSGILYGVMIEFAQKWWVAGRSFEENDMLADSIGALISLLWNRSRL